jgi:hypothetical protein
VTEGENTEISKLANTRARQPVFILIYQCAQTMFVHACQDKRTTLDINRMKGKIRDKRDKGNDMQMSEHKHVKE